MKSGLAIIFLYASIN